MEERLYSKRNLGFMLYEVMDSLSLTRHPYFAAHNRESFDMGWAKLVSGPLQVHELPGDHYSLIKDPEVKQLVKELAISIDLAVSKHAVEAV